MSDGSGFTTVNDVLRSVGTATSLVVDDITNAIDVSATALGADLRVAPDISRAKELLSQGKLGLDATIASPRLVIALAGTTSGGKSSIVNFLCGASIVPVAVTEMSAGVVTIDHHPSRRLVRILPTQGATWECGEWSFEGYDCSDYLRRAMDAYRKLRDSGIDAAPPRVEVEFPTWLGGNAALLGLPENFSLRIVDLPGLKSLNDESNAQVMREEVGKALCLVTYNSEETDPEKRRDLLAQVVAQVRNLRGSPARMLFILNRIDAFRREPDWSSAEASFADEIRSKIRGQIASELREYEAAAQRLEVIPLSSAPAYHALRGAADPSWGIQASEQLDRLYGYLLPAGLVEELPRKWDRWTPTDRSRVFAAALDASRANQFIERLRGHVGANLPQLLLPQHLVQISAAGHEILTALDARLNARLNADDERFQAECERLTNAGRRIAARREEMAKNVEPLRRLSGLRQPAEDAIVLSNAADPIRELTVASLETEKLSGLSGNALSPLYDWSSAIGGCVEGIFFRLVQAIAHDASLATDDVTTYLRPEEIQWLDSAVRQLKSAGYTGEAAQKGYKVETDSGDQKARLRSVNQALNGFASSLSDVLRRALLRVAEREQARIIDALRLLFAHHANEVSATAKAECPEIPAIGAPSLELTTEFRPLQWVFPLAAGFAVHSETRREQSGSRRVLVGQSRHWYTLYLYRHDEYLEVPVYRAREIDSAVVPSIEQVLESFVAQIKQCRAEHMFVGWLVGELESFLDRLARHQGQIIGRYLVLLDEARQQAATTHSESRTSLEESRSDLALLAKRLASIDEAVRLDSRG